MSAPLSEPENRPKSQQHLVFFDEVYEQEKEYIINSRSRQNSGVKDDKLRGLAFSGGGIRSASFAMGVMQALVSEDKLKKFDYLSTVSGGGFTGSALTWALHDDENAGTEKEKFPLGVKNVGARHKQDETKNNRRLNFIRQHGNYLFPDGKLDLISFATYVLRSIITSLIVYLSLMALVAVFFIWLQDFANKYGEVHHYAGVKMGLLIWMGIGALIFYAVLFVALSPLMGLTGTTPYSRSVTQQKWMGTTWKIALGLVLIGTVPFVVRATGEWYAASGGSLFGVLSGIWKYKKQKSNEKDEGALSGITLYLAVFALLYGLMMLAYLFARDIVMQSAGPGAFWGIVAGLVIIPLVFGFFLNINLVGPHQLWRSRIMETFMADKEALSSNTWKPASKADEALMQDMCKTPNERPYHLVNTNIILVNAHQVKYRGRGGDNFMISPKYVGSDATKWRATKDYVNTGRRNITMASAIASSAAALNPSAGVSGAGFTRNRMTSLLLAMLNLRLGFWTSNPDVKRSLFPPGFLFPGFYDEVMMEGLSEKSRNIQLSDGGHFENLAIYELLRRKLELIVICDGGADPKYIFEDLANAVEKVRVDFGIKISFGEEGHFKKYDLSDLLPETLQSTDTNKSFVDKFALATRGFAVAEIYYDDGTKGKLVYVKPTLVENLPADVYSYKGVSPDFPQESTADQMFSEPQFEAYRELGYHIGRTMLTDSETAKLFA